VLQAAVCTIVDRFAEVVNHFSVDGHDSRGHGKLKEHNQQTLVLIKIREYSYIQMSFHDRRL
jgi:hypothetical protein